MVATNFKQVPRRFQIPGTETPILAWWKDHYKKVFVAFHLFFKVKNAVNHLNRNQANGKNSEYLQANWDVFDRLQTNAEDYVKRNAELVLWSDIHSAVCPEVPFDKFALCVWISSVLGRREDVPEELQIKIEKYCDSKNIFLPEDDCLPCALEPKVAEFLTALGLEKIDVYNQFWSNRECYAVDDFLKGHPSVGVPDERNKKYHYGVYGIHCKMLDLLMAWEFDCVYAFIGLSEEACKVAFPERYFEGFYADERTYSDWPNPWKFCPRNY